MVHASWLVDIVDPERFDSEDEAQDFVFASSEFYPDFSVYIATVISDQYPDSGSIDHDRDEEVA